MKALLALASFVGITVKGDETEDQLAAAVAAHKPAPKNIVIDFEDEAVKTAFTARITEATKDDKTKITALETELARIGGLIKNGAAAAAGGNPPVNTPPPAPKAKEMTRSAFNKLPHNERNAFMATGGKLID